MNPLPAAPARTDAFRLAVCLAALLALCLMYRQTLWSMATVWGQSETFTHGALIVPICIVLVWRQRVALSATVSEPYYPALLGVLMLGLLWLAADVANVPVLAQYAVVAMVPVILLAILGRDTVRHIAFPLCFLFLAVPSGEFLIAPLIDFTTAFTVTALQAVGVPVFRDGNMLAIPTGNWAVVEACSGLRYLIACFTLGVLYAHFMYQTWRKRIAFVAMSLALPVLANGVRAFLIVMIGHWSNMKLATGVDHLVYGSLFFLLLLALLFWLGSLWRDHAAAAPFQAPARLLTAEHAAPLSIAVACIGIAALWPITSATLATRPLPQRALSIDLPPGVSASPARQLVQYGGSDDGMSMAYNFDAGRVLLQLALYRQHGDGVRRASSQCADYGSQWRRLSYQVRQVNLTSGSVAVQQSILENQQGRLLAWCWFRQSGIETASASVAKALLAGHTLAGLREDGARIVLATQVDHHPAAAADTLQRFLDRMHQPILHGVDHASAR
jgi:exosortase A